MQTEIDHDRLDDALRRCGANWDAAQAHGLLSSRLALTGAAAGIEWLHLVLDGTDANDALRRECEELLDSVFQATYVQLAERLSEFSPLLPDDEEAAEMRAQALGHWCEGFLHGLVSADHGEALKQRLAGEPLADIMAHTNACSSAGTESTRGVVLSCGFAFQDDSVITQESGISQGFGAIFLACWQSNAKPTSFGRRQLCLPLRNAKLRSK